MVPTRNQQALATPAPNTKPVELYTAKDIFHVAAHLTCSAALVAAATTVVSPAILAAGTALTVLQAAILRSKAKRDIEKHLAPIPHNLPHAAQIHDFSRELSAKIGRKQPVKLYTFMLPENVDQSEFLDSVRLLNWGMKETANAAVMNFGTPAFLISPAALHLLNDGEEKAGLAHEAAHLACKHLKFSIINGSMLTSAFNAIGIAAVMALLHSGLAPVSVAAAGTWLLQPKIKKDYEQKFAYYPEEIRDIPVKDAKLFANAVFLFGLAGILAPSVLQPFALASGFMLATKLISSNLSRRAEFHADRIAVSLGADPLDSITGHGTRLFFLATA